MARQLTDPYFFSPGSCCQHLYLSRQGEQKGAGRAAGREGTQGDTPGTKGIIARSDLERKCDTRALTTPPSITSEILQARQGREAFRGGEKPRVLSGGEKQVVFERGLTGTLAALTHSYGCFGWKKCVKA